MKKKLALAVLKLWIAKPTKFDKNWPWEFFEILYFLKSPPILDVLQSIQINVDEKKMALAVLKLWIAKPPIFDEN